MCNGNQIKNHPAITFLLTFSNFQRKKWPCTNVIFKSSYKALWWDGIWLPMRKEEAMTLNHYRYEQKFALDFSVFVKRIVCILASSSFVMCCKVCLKYFLEDIVALFLLLYKNSKKICILIVFDKLLVSIRNVQNLFTWKNRIKLFVVVTLFPALKFPKSSQCQLKAPYK